MDHITYILELVLEGALHEAAVALLMPSETLDQATITWAAWEPYLFPPPGSGENAIRDVVIATLIPAYNT
jgi:hypothetical protein